MGGAMLGRIKTVETVMLGRIGGSKPIGWENWSF
jgi:hypothetical protein